VGDEQGGVHVFEVGELQRGPLVTLAAPWLPGGARAPCRALAALPPAPQVGGGLLTLHGSFATCFLMGRPPGRPPSPCLIGTAGSGVAGLAWDAGACAAVASRVDGGQLRHAYLAPTLRGGPACAAGGPVDRVWRGYADLLSDAAPTPPALGPALRTTAVPDGGAGGAGLFAAPDGHKQAVMLWRVPPPGQAEGLSRPLPVRYASLAPHSGPVLDVRCDAEARSRPDGAGRLLLSLSQDELHVHARAAAAN